jgi:DnaJ-class molecular chaperone
MSDDTESERPPSETVVIPVEDRCRTHNAKRDTYVECVTCDGSGEVFEEGDYPGDWLRGNHRCHNCGGRGGYMECYICATEVDDYE